MNKFQEKDTKHKQKTKKRGLIENFTDLSPVIELEQTTLQSILQGMTYFVFCGRQKSEQSLLNVILESGTCMKFDLCVEELSELQQQAINEIIQKQVYEGTGISIKDGQKKEEIIQSELPQVKLGERTKQLLEGNLNYIESQLRLKDVW